MIYFLDTIPCYIDRKYLLQTFPQPPAEVSQRGGDVHPQGHAVRLQDSCPPSAQAPADSGPLPRHSRKLQEKGDKNYYCYYYYFFSRDEI